MRRPCRQHKVDAKCRQGRTYGDYCRFLAENPGVHAAELDTVEGRKGGKGVTTLRLRDCGLLLAFLQDRKDAASVTALFNDLWIRLGPDLFQRLFPVILTDNGSEFSDPSSIEKAPDGTPRTRVFYCDPGASNQKGAVERKHVELRRVLEKGTSFDSLTQGCLDLVLSHVNSYSRATRGDRSPPRGLRLHLRRGGRRLTRAAPHPAQRGDAHPQAAGGGTARIAPPPDIARQGHGVAFSMPEKRNCAAPQGRIAATPRSNHCKTSNYN